MRTSPIDDAFRDENCELILCGKQREPLVSAAKLNKGKYPWYNVFHDSNEWIGPKEWIERSLDDRTKMVAAIAIRNQMICDLIEVVAGDPEDEGYLERRAELVRKFDVRQSTNSFRR